MAHLSRWRAPGKIRAFGVQTVMAVLAGAVLSLASVRGIRAEDASLEDAVKATYLYKFAPFVAWPPSALAKPGAFTLCIAGADEVTKLVPQAAAGQQVNGRSIDVRHLADGDSPQDCQILYIASPATAAPLLIAARGKPTLTVTDGGSPDHGIIQFTVVNHHVRFDIDAGLAAEDGLSISSKLLSLANAVTPATQDKP
jgi:hypothetical protein